MEDKIYKTIFQSYPLRINKVNVADPACTNENLFVSVPIVYKVDELFEKLNMDKIQFNSITVEIIPRYNKVGPTEILDEDAAYIDGMFSVKYNFQKGCYVGDGAIKTFSSFEVGGKNGIAESTAIAKFRLPNADCYLANSDGTADTYQEHDPIDTSNLLKSNKTLVFGQLSVGVEKASLMVTKSSQNVPVGGEISSSRYSDFCKEINKNDNKQVKKGKKNPPPDYDSTDSIFIKDQINGKLYLDYHWIANIQYDIQYTRSAKSTN